MLSGSSGDKLKYDFIERTKLFSNNACIKIQLFKTKYILQKNLADSHSLLNKNFTHHTKTWNLKLIIYCFKILLKKMLDLQKYGQKDNLTNILYPVHTRFFP